MPRLLEDARALLDIDRERIRLAREAQDVNREALATARELAQLGDTERPKNLEYVKSIRAESGSFVANPAGGAGRASLPTSSSGAGGGGGAGGAGGGSRTQGPRLLTSRTAGVGTQREDWVYEHCKMVPGGVEIPNPANPLAMVTGDMMRVAAWDCSVAMGVPEAIFLDPAAVEALQPAQRGSSRSGGGSSGGTGRDRLIRGGILGETGVQVNPFKAGRGGSTVGPEASIPTADGKLVEKTLIEGFREVVKELRQSGDIGLQIRRGGL